MILIKNDDHGRLHVNGLTDAQKEAGWYIPEDKAEPVAPEVVAASPGDMSKAELEKYARGFNIELDRRMSKNNMMKSFNRQLDDSK